VPCRRRIAADSTSPLPAHRRMRDLALLRLFFFFYFFFLYFSSDEGGSHRSWRAVFIDRVVRSVLGGPDPADQSGERCAGGDTMYTAKARSAAAKSSHHIL